MLASLARHSSCLMCREECSLRSPVTELSHGGEEFSLRSRVTVVVSWWRRMLALLACHRVVSWWRRMLASLARHSSCLIGREECSLRSPVTVALLSKISNISRTVWIL
uniref:Uncharacterized protein n=1 Tax=Cacopsylla melanoneura TaxID=428564 RepID=A0A8D8W2M1_9HEMI